MSSKKKSSALSSSDLNAIVTAKSDEQLLGKVEAGIENLRTNGAGKISPKSFCAFLDQLVKFSSDSKENVTIQTQYLELVGDILLSEGCSNLLVAEAPKIDAVFCQLLDNWIGGIDSINHGNNDLVIRLCSQLALIDQSRREENKGDPNDCLKVAMVPLFARAINVILQWDTSSAIHVATISALSQLCCTLLRGKSGRKNANELVDSSNNECATLARKWSSIHDFSVQQYLLQVLFRLSKNNANAHPKSKELLQVLDLNTANFFESLQPSQFVVEASEFIQKQAKMNGAISKLECGTVHIGCDKEEFTTDNCALFQTNGYVHIALSGDEGEQLAKLWLDASNCKDVSETGDQTLLLSVQRELPGFREASFLIDVGNGQSKNAILRLDKLSKHSMKSMKEFFKCTQDEQVEKPVTSTTSKKNHKVSVASVVVNGTQDDKASDITSPHKSQDVTTSKTREAQQVTAAEATVVAAVHTPVSTDHKRNTNKGSNGNTTVTPATTDPQEKQRITADTKADFAPEVRASREGTGSAEFQEKQRTTDCKREDIVSECKERKLDGTSNISGHKGNTIAPAPQRKTSNGSQSSTRLRKAPIQQPTQESADPFEFDNSEPRSTRTGSTRTANAAPLTKKDVNRKRARSHSKDGWKNSPRTTIRQKKLPESSRSASTCHSVGKTSLTNVAPRYTEGFPKTQPEKSDNYCGNVQNNSSTNSMEKCKSIDCTSALKRTARQLKGEFDCLNLDSQEYPLPTQKSCAPETRVDSDDELSALMNQVASLVSNLQKKRSGKKMTQKLKKIENSFKTSIESTLEVFSRRQGESLQESLGATSYLEEEVSSNVTELAQLSRSVGSFIWEQQKNLTHIADDFEKLEQAIDETLDDAETTEQASEQLQEKQSEFLSEWNTKCDEIHKKYATTITGISSIVGMKWEA